MRLYEHSGDKCQFYTIGGDFNSHKNKTKELSVADNCGQERMQSIPPNKPKTSIAIKEPITIGTSRNNSACPSTLNNPLMKAIIISVVYPFLFTLKLTNSIAQATKPPSQGPTENSKNELISFELTGVNNGLHHQTASPECWTNVISNLEATARIHQPDIMAYDYEASVSPATNFCTGMSQLQQEVLAVGLTACTLNRTNQLIPQSCLISEVTSALNEDAVKECLSALRESNDYVVYTQFLLYTEQACSTLTRDISIQRNVEAVRKLEKHAVDLGEFKLNYEEFQSKQESVMQNVEKITEESKKKQDELMQKISTNDDRVEKIVRQNENSIDLLTENRKAMLEFVQNVNMKQERLVSEITEMYEGLKDIKNFANTLKNHYPTGLSWKESWELIVKCGRFLSIFFGFFALTCISKRFHPARVYILIACLLEVLVEQIILSLVAIGELTLSQRDFYISFLRRHDIKFHFGLLIWIFISSISRESNENQEDGRTPDPPQSEQRSNTPQVDISASAATLEMLRSELKADREANARMYREAHVRMQQQVNNEIVMAQHQMDPPSRHQIQDPQYPAQQRHQQLPPSQPLEHASHHQTYEFVTPETSSISQNHRTRNHQPIAGRRSSRRIEYNMLPTPHVLPLQDTATPNPRSIDVHATNDHSVEYGYHTPAPSRREIFEPPEAPLLLQRHRRRRIMTNNYRAATPHYDSNTDNSNINGHGAANDPNQQFRDNDEEFISPNSAYHPPFPFPPHSPHPQGGDNLSSAVPDPVRSDTTFPFIVPDAEQQVVGNELSRKRSRPESSRVDEDYSSENDEGLETVSKKLKF